MQTAELLAKAVELLVDGVREAFLQQRQLLAKGIDLGVLGAGGFSALRHQGLLEIGKGLGQFLAAATGGLVNGQAQFALHPLDPFTHALGCGLLRGQRRRKLGQTGLRGLVLLQPLQAFGAGQTGATVSAPHQPQQAQQREQVQQGQQAHLQTGPVGGIRQMRSPSRQYAGARRGIRA